MCWPFRLTCKKRFWATSRSQSRVHTIMFPLASMWNTCLHKSKLNHIIMQQGISLLLTLWIFVCDARRVAHNYCWWQLQFWWTTRSMSRWLWFPVGIPRYEPSFDLIHARYERCTRVRISQNLSCCNIQSAGDHLFGPNLSSLYNSSKWTHHFWKWSFFYCGTRASWTMTRLEPYCLERIWKSFLNSAWKNPSFRVMSLIAIIIVRAVYIGVMNWCHYCRVLGIWPE